MEGREEEHEPTGELLLQDVCLLGRPFLGAFSASTTTSCWVSSVWSASVCNVVVSFSTLSL